MTQRVCKFSLTSHHLSRLCVSYLCVLCDSVVRSNWGNTMGKGAFTGPLEQIDATCCRIPKSYKQGMRVDGLIFASEKLMQTIRADEAPDQVANVAFLPGIQGASLAMPDIHWGYGFCIGGVCAPDPAQGGGISP